MSRAAQKEWTKTMATLRLKDIDNALSDVQKLAENGGKMPSALRVKLQNALKKVEIVQQAFKEWQP